MEQGKAKGHVALLVANIIFGLNTPISRTLIPETLSPYTLTIFRMVGGAILFWGVSLFVKKEHVPLKDIGLLAVASLFGIVLNQMPFVVGLSYTSPIDASIVVTLLPVLSMIFAAIFLREPITFLKVSGIIVGASGALLLILGHHSSEISSNNNMIGDLIIFIGICSFSLYLTLFKGLITRYKPITLMKWMFLFASIFCLPFCAKDLMLTDFSSMSADVYWRVGYIVVLATFITYFLIPVGQKVLRPTTVSMYNYLQPVVSSLVAVFIGMDIFGWDKAMAAVLVFLGVYIVTKSKSKAQLEAEKTQDAFKA